MYRTYPNRYPAFEKLKTFFRDTTTLAFHEEIVHKFTERIKSIPQIECIMLIGSLGNNEGDIFSDIDFAVIHNEEKSYSSTLRDIIMENILESDDVLYYYTSGFENRIIFIKPLIKFELIVRTIEEARSRWKYAKAKIVYDKTGIGESIK